MIKQLKSAWIIPDGERVFVRKINETAQRAEVEDESGFVYWIETSELAGSPEELDQKPEGEAHS